jgi:hypothetical protein
MSDSTKFTRGPWETHVSSDFLQVRAVGSNDPICEFGLAPADDWTSEDRIEVQANADITAAAPCMFEALKAWEAYVDKWFDASNDMQGEAYKLTKAALLKARGETSLAQAEAEDASK